MPTQAERPDRVGYACCMRRGPGASGVPGRGTQCGQNWTLDGNPRIVNNQAMDHEMRLNQITVKSCPHSRTPSAKQNDLDASTSRQEQCPNVVKDEPYSALSFAMRTFGTRRACAHCDASI